MNIATILSSLTCMLKVRIGAQSYKAYRQKVSLCDVGSHWLIYLQVEVRRRVSWSHLTEHHPQQDQVAVLVVVTCVMSATHIYLGPHQVCTAC